MSKRIIGAVSIVVVVAVGSTTYLNSQPTPPETSSITTAQIGCPDGMIEDMSVVECVVDGRVSLDAPDRNLAVQRRELANTLLTENSDRKEVMCTLKECLLHDFGIEHTTIQFEEGNCGQGEIAK